jgi:hypothetical protein
VHDLIDGAVVTTADFGSRINPTSQHVVTTRRDESCRSVTEELLTLFGE